MSILSLALGLGLAACARAPYHYQAPAAASPQSAAAGPQLLFLSFRVQTAPAGEHRFELLQARAVPGAVVGTAGSKSGGTASLLLTQLDAQGQPCGPATTVPHPLLRDTEAPSPTDSSRFVRRQRRLREAEFFVRLARQPQARTVRVEEQGAIFAVPVSVSFYLPN
ncbi:hypothetical protein Q5H93_22300 [Hymenobacter sp. ASUV-10]|uniref:Lipoprotein n=1 Tax=Hymenobacter aranciens TaxID=3063996 RepID=A0ABT9BGU6_9BACT|nr:hypothetical protein [Hymenobacter sp. ASUV-10]MDO7877487.1 hypothetical protein [Hymenobacter sp. ASUV-10]